MIQTVTKSGFIRSFRDADRENQFSREALELLFDYFDDSGLNVELDVIAICCDYAENSTDDIIENYSIDIDEDMDEDDKDQTVETFLNDHSMVIGKTEVGFVYLDF